MFKEEGHGIIVGLSKLQILILIQIIQKQDMQYLDSSLKVVMVLISNKELQMIFRLQIFQQVQVFLLLFLLALEERIFVGDMGIIIR